MIPDWTAIGRAASGRWWLQCTRPGCTHRTSALRTREEAAYLTGVHQRTHQPRKDTCSDG